MPCRDFLSQLRAAHDEITSLGAGVIAAATGAHFQAERLMAEGVPFPCLVDPAKALYSALDIRRIQWFRWFLPSTWWKYFRPVLRARQGRITGDVQQAPGVAIINTDGTILYLHRGRTLGDYPPLSQVLDRLRDVTRRDAT